MSLNDEIESTFTDVAVDAQSGVAALSTTGSDELVVFIDDGTGSAPADFTVVIERYSEIHDRWMEYSRTSQTGASNPQSVTTEAVPTQMRGSVVNDSAGTADFRLNLVSY